MMQATRTMVQEIIPEENLIDVWIVEDDLPYRDTISYILEHVDGLTSSGAFTSFEELESFLASGGSGRTPDLILMDVGLPGLNGIEAVKALKHQLPDVPVVMLTISDSSELLFGALSAGASGYLLKDTPIDRILSAIREAVRGGMLFPPSIARRLMDYFRNPQEGGDNPLSERENDVLKLMSGGLAHKQIADQLCISTHTVENHCRSIYKKLHVHSGVQAVSKALREGLV